MTEFESDMMDTASELIAEFGAEVTLTSQAVVKDPAQPWRTTQTPVPRTVTMAKTEQSVIHKDRENLPAGKSYALLLAGSEVKVGDQITDALGLIWSVEAVEAFAPGATILAYEVVLKK